MSKVKLQSLIDRIAKLKIFDPACGSGNFLIIAYKELRKLEMKILKQIDKVSNMKQGELFDSKSRYEQLSFLSLSSRIELTQFYGIELDDFAHEVATLSLWLAEHQMNKEFFKEFGQTNPPLPLKRGGNIVQGNATRLNWEEVCPKEDGDEIYILGNPPYVGKKEQNAEQKSDLDYVAYELINYKNLDYISCWFLKASEYMYSSNISCAFVSTNSISQGEQVGLIWPYLLDKNLEIFFAYTPFMWKNNAKQNAGVAVVIIGLRNTSSNVKIKRLYSGPNIFLTSKINPYLSIGNDVIVYKRSKPLSHFPDICNGSMANDNGHFFLNEDEYEKLPNHLRIFYKQTMGAYEFFHSVKRYCLWLDEKNLSDAIQYKEINEIIEQVRLSRKQSNREATKKLAELSYRFGEVRYQKGSAIIVPGLSAEKRTYIPLGFVDENIIVTNLAQVIYDAEPWLFGILSSKLNNLWVRTTSGYFKKDIRYSPLLSYNTFPFPNISEQQKDQISEHVFNILHEREQHSEKTLAQLYDPDKMPSGLREAHHQLDLAIERCYRAKLFESDEERLEYLFKLYEEMVGREGKK